MNKEDYKIAYENVMVANKMLEQEIERLNNIINELLNRQNEALRYIETYKDIQSKNVYVDFDLEDIDNLLDILRGEDKE